jgi:hypothetical protein
MGQGPQKLKPQKADDLIQFGHSASELASFQQTAEDRFVFIQFACGGGAGAGPGQNVFALCANSFLDLNQTANETTVFNRAGSHKINLVQCPSSDLAGPGSDVFALCAENRLSLQQVANQDATRELEANSQINLRQTPNADLFGLGTKAGSSPGVETAINDKGIVNRNVSRRINQTLYSLKRLWGGSFVIYSIGDATVDHLTGTQDEPAQVIPIKRGIILPGKHMRGIKQTIAMISANKSFVTGGTYDTTARTFIVDRVDAPNLDLTESDYIIYDNKRYEVKEFQEFEFDSAWVIAGQALEGETPIQIRLLSADNLIRLDQLAAQVP